jgi:hypothetical protein
VNQSRATEHSAKIDVAAGPDVSLSLPETRHLEVSQPRETGGPAGLEPTRYGDWERVGRCIDF